MTANTSMNLGFFALPTTFFATPHIGTYVVRYICADRLCGRNRRFVYELSIINNYSSNLMSHSVKVSVDCIAKLSEIVGDYT